MKHRQNASPGERKKFGRPARDSALIPRHRREILAQEHLGKGSASKEGATRRGGFEDWARPKARTNEKSLAKPLLLKGGQMSG